MEDQPTRNAGVIAAAAGRDIQETDAIALGIGQVLRELRKQRGLSLNDLARQCGVSRSMLSQIEKGQSIPSVLVLYKIAATLGLPVAAFLKTEGALPSKRLSWEETSLRITAEGKCAWRSLMPSGQERRTEFYELTLRPGGIEKIPPYPQGTRVNLALNQGSLLVALGRFRHRLEEGDVLEFAASQAHDYINPGAQEALAFLILRHP